MKSNFSKQNNINAAGGAVNDEETRYGDGTIPNEGKKEERKESKGKFNWKKAGVAVAAGAAVGIGGAVLGDELYAQDSENQENVENQGDVENQGEAQENVGNESEVIEAQTTDADNMSFSEAFAQARAEMGPGHVFEWHGNSYTTDYREEVEAQHQANPAQGEAHEDDGESEIEILGVSQDNTGGEVVEPGASSIDGNDVIIVDIEPDMVPEPDGPEMDIDVSVEPDADYTNDAVL